MSQVEGHSLAAQERLFGELCRSREWEAVAVYREEWQPAHTESMKKRPMFRQLMEDASRDSFDIVVVHTLDRWSRNLRVTLESLAILAMHDVALVSITENIDYSTPQGRLLTQMLGSFAQFFSDMLGTHVSKGLDERAHLGLHTGGIPFGYQSCWVKEHGERKLTCEAEHPGGLHLVEGEAKAVRKLFRWYSTGTATLNSLAEWLNDKGFRTRNTRKLLDPDGKVRQGSRLFTHASVRGILHNAFYAGLVKHRERFYPGL
jgi:DNA invertase Pin-like site-specific DNA recombinase